MQTDALLIRVNGDSIRSTAKVFSTTKILPNLRNPMIIDHLTNQRTTGSTMKVVFIRMTNGGMEFCF
jgi:hypothetical protein